MIGDETIDGKKVFEVGFLDFCRIANRTERRTKFSLDNDALMEHIINTRYSKKYIASFEGINLDPTSVENSPRQKSTDNETNEG